MLEQHSVPHSSTMVFLYAFRYPAKWEKKISSAHEVSFRHERHKNYSKRLQKKDIFDLNKYVIFHQLY